MRPEFPFGPDGEHANEAIERAVFVEAADASGELVGALRGEEA